MAQRKPLRSALLVTALVVGSLVFACFLWVKKEQYQYALDRALIEALHQGEFEQASGLVEAEGDPNTPVIPLPAPTWRDLLNQLLRHSSAPFSRRQTAFSAVYGGILPSKEVGIRYVIPLNRLGDPQLTQVAQKMLDHGANVNAQDEDGTTALMYAVDVNITDRMALLLAHNATVDLQDNNGDTALNSAVDAHNVQAIKLLLKYHARIHRQGLRIGYKDPEVIALLEDAGVKK